MPLTMRQLIIAADSIRIRRILTDEAANSDGIQLESGDRLVGESGDVIEREEE